MGCSGSGCSLASTSGTSRCRLRQNYTLARWNSHRAAGHPGSELTEVELLPRGSELSPQRRELSLWNGPNLSNWWHWRERAAAAEQRVDERKLIGALLAVVNTWSWVARSIRCRYDRCASIRFWRFAVVPSALAAGTLAAAFDLAVAGAALAM